MHVAGFLVTRYNRRMLRRSFLALWPASFALGQRNNWDEPFPPHRIADNLYYVGSAGLASYLVTTPAGAILINTSFERTIPIRRREYALLLLTMSVYGCA